MPERQPTPGSRRVRIRIDSRAGGERLIQQAEGDLYAKGSHYYIRYPEASQGGAMTTTTLKLEPNAIKIMRRGDVISDQSFVPGEKRLGYYETAGVRLELATRTMRWEPNLADGAGTLLWSYDLEVAGSPPQSYSVKLTIEDIQEEQKL